MFNKSKKQKVLSPGIKKVLKALKIGKNVLLTIVLVFLASTLVLTVIARVNGEAPTLFGYTVYRVTSGSMVPYLQVGDIILSHECDPMALKDGDVITYNGLSGQLAGKRVTHRVVKAPYVDENDGQYYLLTKGDDNPVEDAPVALSQVTGIMTGKLDFLKGLYDFFITPWGLLIIIALIIAAFFNEIINFGKALFGYGHEEEEDIQKVIERIQREDSTKDKKE